MAARFRRAAGALDAALAAWAPPSAPPCECCGEPAPAYKTVEGVAYRRCAAGHNTKSTARGRVA